jgi:hypothetical protein
MLGNLENKGSLWSATLELNLEGVEDRGKVLGVKVNIDDGTNDGFDGTDLVGSSRGVGSGRGGLLMSASIRSSFSTISPKFARSHLMSSSLACLLLCSSSL